MLLVGGATLASTLGGGGSPKWHGVTVDPAQPKPEFTLTDTSGKPYDFASQTAGQLTFLFFGYTHCPDVCPVTMATLSTALRNLNGVSAKIVFVTTDPARDTPSVLRSWLDQFDPRIVGLTGTHDQVVAAQNAAGVTAAIADSPDSNGNYVVGHSAQVLVFTPDGKQHLFYSSSTTQSDWAADIPKIVAEKAWSTSS